MKIKEIIKIAADFTAREKVFSSLSSSATETDKTVLSEIDLFTRLVNLVTGELAASYIPMKKEEKITATDGIVRYSALKENPIKILGVYDSYGNKLSFTVFPEYMRVCGGEITLIYAYSPANAGLDEETGYTEKDVSAEVLALGTAAEYCLIAGRTEEAVAFRKRFSAGVERFCMPENKRIKRRGWL